MTTQEREALFISHASPEDNAFCLWLGAKLAAMGYEVWADVLRLRGGDDWQRKLEDALRNRTSKVLLVANAASVQKQGVRNEIQIASDVSKKIGDAEFIIPLRMSAYEKPFLIAHSQYIDFEKGWSKGLHELLDVLPTPPAKSASQSAMWRSLQQIHGKSIIETPELLRSNWVGVTQLPKHIVLYEFKTGVATGIAASALESCSWPLAPFGDLGFLSCASFDELQSKIDPSLPISQKARRGFSAFMESGWPKEGIETRDARRIATNLIRQGLEDLFLRRGLQGYELSNHHIAWWGDIATVPTTKVGFRWPGTVGLRQIQGRSDKRKMNWHYGVSVAFRMFPQWHVRFSGRLVFTEDGKVPFGDPAKMHRLRRSFAKSWRNARWRDMLLAFLSWLASGADRLEVPVGGDFPIILRLPPRGFQAPVSIPVAAENPEADDDDPSDDDEVEPEDG